MRIDEETLWRLENADSLSFSVNNYVQADMFSEYKENPLMMTEELIKYKVGNDLDGIFGSNGENWDEVIRDNGYDFLNDYLDRIGGQYNYGEANSYNEFVENTAKSNVYNLNYEVEALLETRDDFKINDVEFPVL